MVRLTFWVQLLLFVLILRRSDAASDKSGELQEQIPRLPRLPTAAKKLLPSQVPTNSPPFVLRLLLSFLSDLFFIPLSSSKRQMVFLFDLPAAANHALLESCSLFCYIPAVYAPSHASGKSSVSLLMKSRSFGPTV
jgi:hypothetical protein